MKIETVNTCLNCENLLNDFVCKKHNTSVRIDNFCENHSYQKSINKNSSCSNCFNFGKSSCSNPEEASSSMLCFDWKVV